MTEAKAQDATAGTAAYTYDADGHATEKVLGNGAHTYFAYDAVGRTTKIENRLPGGTLLAYFAYTYDAAGRLTKSLREAGNVVYYGYDDANRLASETWKDSGGSTLHGFEWEYDLVGNRTYQKRGTDRTYFSYDDGNQLTQLHELPADTWTYFDYDSRGNCTEIDAPAGTTSLTYNDADLVAEIEYADATMNYFHYDALQRRYAMEDSAGLAYFTWDRDKLCPLAERDAAGGVTASYTRGHAPVAGIGDLAAAKLTVGEDTYYQFPLYDHRGNVAVVTDENAVAVGYFDYDAWGTKLRDDAPPEGTRFGQSAPAWLELKDSDGSLALSPTRLYHKPTGRFLQRDPLNRGMHSLYPFGDNDPVKSVDPLGLIATGAYNNLRRLRQEILHFHRLADESPEDCMKRGFAIMPPWVENALRYTDVAVKDVEADARAYKAYTKLESQAIRAGIFVATSVATMGVLSAMAAAGATLEAAHGVTATVRALRIATAVGEVAHVAHVLREGAKVTAEAYMESDVYRDMDESFQRSIRVIWRLYWSNVAFGNRFLESLKTVCGVGGVACSREAITDLA